jgi:T5orf172 domain
MKDVSNGRGCPDCGERKRADSHRFKEQESDSRLFERAIQRLGPFVAWKVKTLLLCTICGCKWNAAPISAACPDCFKRRHADSQRLTKDRLQKHLSDLERRGITMLSEYINRRNKGLFRCRCGNKWRVETGAVFDGSGCSNCANYGFQSGKPAMLYYVRVTNPFGDPVYKIGVTNRTMQERFERESRKITIIQTVDFDSGTKAYEIEQAILKDYDADRYEGPDILEVGNDELFNCDVLQLDKCDRQLELLV